MSGKVRLSYRGSRLGAGSRITAGPVSFRGFLFRFIMIRFVRFCVLIGHDDYPLVGKSQLSQCGEQAQPESTCVSAQPNWLVVAGDWLVPDT